MTGEASDGLDPALLEEWYGEHASCLRAFLTGVLKDASLTEEALQRTFTKALTHGGQVQLQAVRAWLYQVAYREALQMRRQQATERKHLPHQQQVSWLHAPDESLLREELVAEIQSAVESLPESQRIIVQLRMHQEKTFQEIADELRVPLGTVLTRMRAALKKLEQLLDSHS